eukprot:8849262-Heterocapsa_arctica.AAC.1
MVTSNESGLPGPGTIDQVLGPLRYDEVTKQNREDLEPTWGPVSVNDGTCTYYDIFDAEDQDAL